MPIPIIILLCALGVLVLLCAVCAVRAARMKKTLPDTPAAVTWTDGEADKYAKDLSEMVKIPTVSRKQEEDYPDFLVFQKKLEELFPLFFSQAENHDISGNILRRLPGKNPKRGALLLMGHQDVVPERLGEAALLGRDRKRLRMGPRRDGLQEHRVLRAGGR